MNTADTSPDTELRPAAVSAGPERRHGGQRWHWLPRMLVESVLIVFSVLFALAMDQWRTERTRAEQAVIALRSVRTELEQNLENVHGARSNHIAMRDSLNRYIALQEPPPSHVYLHGIFNPAPILDIAWESAREAGTTADLPYELVLDLAHVYYWQGRYRAIGDALVEDMMMQVRREGMEAVLRDRAATFVSIQEDFATREAALIEEYERVLAILERRAVP